MYVFLIEYHTTIGH